MPIRTLIDPWLRSQPRPTPAAGPFYGLESVHRLSVYPCRISRRRRLFLARPPLLADGTVSLASLYLLEARFFFCLLVHLRV